MNDEMHTPKNICSHVYFLGFGEAPQCMAYFHTKFMKRRKQYFKNPLTKALNWKNHLYFLYIKVDLMRHLN